MSTELLSRAQFGITIGFHILFPTLNMGLGLFLVYMEGMWLKTRQPVYFTICQFWSKIFALTFGMGVVSGVVLSYEIGTNFAGYSRAVGAVLGPLFTYEVLSAFFLEAGFLGIMLFGWHKVSRGVHFMATCLVTAGTTLSAFWILCANSWMQIPSRYHWENGQFTVQDWWQIIWSPAALPRFLHMVLASYVTTCFVIAGVSAYYLLKKKHLTFSRKNLSVSLIAAAILLPFQIGVGDTLGLKIREYQPLKTAAIEAIWQTQQGAPFVI